MSIRMTAPHIIEDRLHFDMIGETYNKVVVKAIRIRLVNHMKPTELSVLLIKHMHEAMEYLENELGRH